MTFLAEIRSMLTRRKAPVMIEVTGTQAEKLSQDPLIAAAATSLHSGAGEQLLATAPDSDTESDANAPHNGTSAPPPQSEDELTTLLRQVRTHLDDQTQVSRKTVAGIDRLAQTADALHRLDRHAGQLVAMATEHFGQEKSRSDNTSQALTTIRETSQHHTEVLGLTQQQLDANARTLDRVADTLDHIQQGVASVAAASDQTAELLTRLDRATDDGSQAMRDFIARTQRTSLVVLAGCASASILAVVVAILALVQRGGG